jgi:hypothetical protein
VYRSFNMPENNGKPGKSFLAGKAAPKDGNFLLTAQKPVQQPAIKTKTSIPVPLTGNKLSLKNVPDATRALALLSSGIQRCIQAKATHVPIFPAGKNPRVIQRSSGASSSAAAAAVPPPPPAIQRTGAWHAHRFWDKTLNQYVTNYRAPGAVFGQACVIEVKGSALRHEFHTPSQVIAELNGMSGEFSDAWDHALGGGLGDVRLGGSAVQSILFRYNGGRLSIFHAQRSAGGGFFSSGLSDSKKSWRT